MTDMGEIHFGSLYLSWDLISEQPMWEGTRFGKK